MLSLVLHVDESLSLIVLSKEIQACSLISVYRLSVFVSKEKKQGAYENFGIIFFVVFSTIHKLRRCKMLELWFMARRSAITSIQGLPAQHVTAHLAMNHFFPFIWATLNELWTFFTLPLRIFVRCVPIHTTFYKEIKSRLSMIIIIKQIVFSRESVRESFYLTLKRT